MSLILYANLESTGRGHQIRHLLLIVNVKLKFTGFFNQRQPKGQFSRSLIISYVNLMSNDPLLPTAGRAQRAVSLRSERSMSRGFPSLELDTVLEERSDPEQTQASPIALHFFLHIRAQD